MKKNILVAIIIFLLSLTSYTTVFALAGNSNKPPREALLSAESYFEVYKNAIPYTYETYGYNSMDEIQSIQLGESYRVFLFNPERLMKANKNSEFLSTTDDVDSWGFIVKMNEVPKDIIWVRKDDRGEYKIVFYGLFRSVPIELLTAIDNFKNLMREKGSKDLNPKLVYVGDEYFLVGRVNGKEYISVSDNPNGSNKSYNNMTLRTSKEIILPLKEILNDRNIEKKKLQSRPICGPSLSSSMEKKAIELKQQSSILELYYILVGYVLFLTVFLKIKSKRYLFN